MMRFSRNPTFLLELATSVNRRRHGRVRCESTSSCIGNILDISASGMRVQRRGRAVLKVGEEFSICVHPDADEPDLTLPARVIWIEHTGLLKHVYGIEFIQLGDEQKQHLGDLARMACDQIVFRSAS